MKKNPVSKLIPQKKFRVMVKEVFKCYVEVDAANKDDARDIVERQVEDCDLIAPRDYDTFDRKVTVLRIVRSDP